MVADWRVSMLTL